MINVLTTNNCWAGYCRYSPTLAHLPPQLHLVATGCSGITQHTHHDGILVLFVAFWRQQAVVDSMGIPASSATHRCEVCRIGRPQAPQRYLSGCSAKQGLAAMGRLLGTSELPSPQNTHTSVSYHIGRGRAAAPPKRWLPAQRAPILRHAVKTSSSKPNLF